VHRPLVVRRDQHPRRRLRGDFGAILELITGDYEAMLPKVTSALATDGSRLEQTGDTLQSIRVDFERTDAHVAQLYGR
jgi:hypothetical protein